MVGGGLRTNHPALGCKRVCLQVCAWGGGVGGVCGVCIRWGCDFLQHVGINTSAPNVWLPLVITLHLI